MTVDSKYQQPKVYENTRGTEYTYSFESIGSEAARLVQVDLNTDPPTTSTLTYGFHYSIEYSDYRGDIPYAGTITLAAPLDDQNVLRIERKTPITNTIDFANADILDPRQIEYAFDKICFIEQEIEGHYCDCRGFVQPETPTVATPGGSPLFECLPYQCDVLESSYASLLWLMEPEQPADFEAFWAAKNLTQGPDMALSFEPVAEPIDRCEVGANQAIFSGYGGIGSSYLTYGQSLTEGGADGSTLSDDLRSTSILFRSRVDGGLSNPGANGELRALEAGARVDLFGAGQDIGWIGRYITGVERLGPGEVDRLSSALYIRLQAPSGWFWLGTAFQDRIDRYSPYFPIANDAWVLWPAVFRMSRPYLYGGTGGEPLRVALDVEVKSGYYFTYESTGESVSDSTFHLSGTCVSPAILTGVSRLAKQSELKLLNGLQGTYIAAFDPEPFDPTVDDDILQQEFVKFLFAYQRNKNDYIPPGYCGS